MGIPNRGENEPRAVVVTVMVTEAPAGAGFGLNVACAPGGKPEAAKVTVFGKPLAVDGAIMNVNCAGCPACDVSALVSAVGVKLSAVNVSPAEVIAFGSGLDTVISTSPPWLLSVAGIIAVRRDALTKVVVSALPLNLTTDPETKFAPFTVRAGMAAPALACAGESDVIAGMGFVMVTWADAVTAVPAKLVTVNM